MSFLELGVKPTKHYLHVNGIEIYIEYANLTHASSSEEKSTPKSFPVVLQHGHTAHHFFLKPIYDYLQTRGWPVIMFDLRGHGWSEKGLTGQYTLEHCVNDLYGIYSSFIKEQWGYDQFYLIGHSMGGFIAQLYAARYPKTLRKLILISTSAKMNTNFVLNLGLTYVKWSYRHRYEHEFAKKRQSHEKLGFEFLPQWTIHPELLPDKDASVEFLEAIRHYDALATDKRLTMPVYVLAGGKDMMKRYVAQMTKVIPQARGEVLEGFGHNIGIDGRAVISPKIEAFLLE